MVIPIIGNDSSIPRKHFQTVNYANNVDGVGRLMNAADTPDIMALVRASGKVWEPIVKPTGTSRIDV